MGKRVDPKKGERGLGFLEFNVKKEELGPLVRVIELKRGGDKGKLGLEGRERELGFRMELMSIEENKGVEGTGRGEGEDAAEE